jgi:hypothetical protein
MIESEVWLVTWFCLGLSDPICARLEGAPGYTPYASRELCETIARYGANVYRRKYKLPLGYVCTHIVDVYRPVPRPKSMRDQGLDLGLPWPELIYRTVR